MSTELTEKLLVLAAKKKYVGKYAKKVENAFDELLVHFVESGEYSKGDKAFRLMLRIKQALMSEGYKFRVDPVSSGVGPGGSLTKTPSDSVHLICVGGLCALLKSHPPKGLDLDVTVKLLEYIGSKQCYRFELKPSDPSSLRSTGSNLCLPKPLTWAKMEQNGVTRQNIVTSDGRILMEEFRVDGITAYTLDRKAFFTGNAGTCRRWVAGIDRIVSSLLTGR